MESVRIYVSKNFHIMLEDFIKKFKEIHGIDLNIIQATDLIQTKIKKAGGFNI